MPRTLAAGVLAMGAIGMLAMGLAASSAAQAANPEVLSPSTATYRVQYRGINAGTAAFTLRAAGDGRWVYESKSNAEGLARMVIRNEVHEASTFTVEGARLQPAEYLLDDGSPDTAKDTRLTFEWSAQVARGTHEDQPIEIPLQPGLQDRMSVQVQVMMMLARGEAPARIEFIDRDAVKEYAYQHEGEERVKTALGEQDTVIYSSQRDGSNRVSKIWYAPALGYLPVRAEQVRRGKVETILTLESVQRPE